MIKSWGKPIGGGRERVLAGTGINILPPSDQRKNMELIQHMYLALLGPLRTSFEPKDWFPEVRNYARCSYNNVYTFDSAPQNPNPQKIFLRFVRQLLFWYLFIPLPALPYSRVPLLGSPMRTAICCSHCAARSLARSQCVWNLRLLDVKNQWVQDMGAVEDLCQGTSSFGTD